MTLAEKALITIMRQRLAVPRPILAELFGIAPNTVATGKRQIKPLLQQAGLSIEPATSPFTILVSLTEHATPNGAMLMPKTKPVR